VLVAVMIFAARPEVPVATVTWASGDVVISDSRAGGGAPVAEAKRGTELMPWHRIACGEWSAVCLGLPGGSRLVIDSDSSVAGGEGAEDEWRLARGKVIVTHADGAPELRVATPEATVVTRGTAFEVARRGGRTSALVRSGAVVIRPVASADEKAGGRTVEAGHEGTVDASGQIAVARVALSGDAAGAVEAARLGGVLLRYRLAEGMKWRWRVERSLRFEAEEGGGGDGLAMLARALLGRGEDEIKLSAEVDFAVEGVREGRWGVILAGPADRGVRLEADARGRRRLVASSGRGSALSMLDPERSFHLTGADLVPRLPGPPVRPGDTWEHSAKGTVLTVRGGRLALRLDLLVRCRLAKPSAPGAGGGARPRGVVIEQEVVRRNFELVDPGRDRVIVTVRSKGSGRAVFDPAAGRLVESDLEMETRFSPRGGRMGDVGYTEKISQRLAGRAAE
jgi:hypothetical protein